MNTIQIGRLFEEEAYQFLKERFNKIVWLSEKKPSIFDFKIVKDGIDYFGDAKFTKDNPSVRLSYSQRNASFVIIKNRDKIFFLWKKDFGKKVSFAKNEKILKISEKTWKIIIRMKYEYGYKSIDEVLEKILKIVPASDLVKEKKK